MVEAMEYLVTLELFKDIKISDEWKEVHGKKTTEKFIADQVDSAAYTAFDTKIPMANELEKDDDEGEEDHFIANNPAFVNQDTLLTNTFAIAPGEGNIPLPLLDDEFAEELTFLKIYGGHKRAYPRELTYAAICKSEFRRYDRRCAENLPKLFYSYKKLVAQKLRDSINTCLKKSTMSKHNLNAGTVRDQAKMNELFASHEASVFMRTIRSSPQYWEWKLMELHAMLRQLGCPTFFITFSPSEVDWYELIVVLMHVVEGRRITLDEAAKIPREDRLQLINSDPVTVARYFENRMRKLLLFAESKGGPFRHHPIVDYFWRVDFQYRGSPHVHMITWNRNAIMYEPNCDTKEAKIEMLLECTQFIDSYITCHRPQDHTVREIHTDKPHIRRHVHLKYQMHVHKDNCRVKKDDEVEVCKYGYPWPLLEHTMILEPITEEELAECGLKQEDVYNGYLQVRLQLERVHKECHDSNKLVSLKKFLSKEYIDMSFSNYVFALRASIIMDTVFLKRTCRELMLNMDIQFILNPYGCASYVTAYMLKGNAVMSNLLKKASKEMKGGNFTIRQKLNTISSKFQNCSEVSAQEAVYTLLSMNVSKSSRETIYVNTFPEKERASILKEDDVLARLNPDSTSIFKLGLVDHYKNRPEPYEHMCLAEFAADWNYVTNTAYSTKDKPHALPFNEDELDEDEYDKCFRENRLANYSSSSGGEDDSDVERGDAVSESEEAHKEKEEKYIKLMKNDGYIVHRTRSRILRYKRYNKHQDRYNYYRVQLMMFMAWRNESKELEVKDTMQKYLDNLEEIMHNKGTYESVIGKAFVLAQEEVRTEIRDVYEKRQEENANRMDQADELLRNYFGSDEEDEVLAEEFDVVEKSKTQSSQYTSGSSQHMPRSQSMHTQSDNGSVAGSIGGGGGCGRRRPQIVNREEIETEFGYHANILDPFMLQPDGKMDQTRSICVPRRATNEEYLRIMNNLNAKQHAYLMNYLSYLKRDEQFFHFLRGGSGTGKSHLIKAIYQATLRYLHPNEKTYNPDDLFVLVGALTGKAAFNIKGDTLTRIFHLPTHTNAFPPLADTSVKKIQLEYAKVKLIILDEISMIGCKNFMKIDARMRQIMNKPDTHMGGVSILVVGDFNQVPPIQELKVWRNGSLDAYACLVENTLWQKFRLYELTQIMRQSGAEHEFAQALNRLGDDNVYALNDEQIQMLDSRITREADIPPEAIFLFWEKKDVAAYNVKKLNEAPGLLIDNVALDQPEGNGKNLSRAKKMAESCKHIKDLDKTNGLPYVLQLKVNCKYMITNNQNVQDGLVNGACGVLRKIVEHNRPSPEKLLVKRLWIEFDDPDVGIDIRNKEENRQHYLNDGMQSLDRLHRCTPLSFQVQTIKKSVNVGEAGKAQAFHIERSQFALIPCEALTIHKAQGQTYSCVAVSLARNLTKELLYVALSRVTTLGGLYLFDGKSVLRQKYKDMSMEMRLKLVQATQTTHEVHLEMKRLRDHACLEDRFSFLTTQVTPLPNELSIMYHNVRNFHAHHHSIMSDQGFMRSDILLLVSGAVNFNYTIEDRRIHGYKTTMITGSRQKNSSKGQLCYIKDEKSPTFTFIKHNIPWRSGNEWQELSNEIVELSLFRYTHLVTNRAEVMIDIWLCMVYKHPEMKNNMAFYRILKEFLESNFEQWQNNNRTNRERVFIFGDFNIDFNKKEQAILNGLSTIFELRPLFIQTPTNDHGNQIDWAFTNVNNPDDGIIRFECQVYESWFSDHKPIRLMITFPT